jgi:hypothetical protein
VAEHRAKQGRPCSGPPEERLGDKPHFIDRKENGSDMCVVCKANCRKGKYIVAKQ